MASEKVRAILRCLYVGGRECAGCPEDTLCAAVVKAVEGVEK